VDTAQREVERRGADQQAQDDLQPFERVAPFVP